MVRVMTNIHVPVLLEPTLDALRVRPDGRYLDATLGGGGHSKMILKSLGPDGYLLGIDRDAEAVRVTGERLSVYGDRFRAFHGNYSQMTEIAAASGVMEFDGILLDAGLSSNQLEDGERGFSFREEGPLDMRMDRSQSMRARDWLAETGEDEMTRVFREYGEERMGRRIAKALIAARSVRPLETTNELAEVVSRCKGVRDGGRGSRRTHPATQIFQAVRIAVNAELQHLQQAMDDAMALLAPGGRLVVISFHSLEDRIVKRTMTRHVGREVSLQEGGSRWEGDLPRVKWVVKKPTMACREEQVLNPRARSAKLRAVERGTK